MKFNQRIKNSKPWKRSTMLNKVTSMMSRIDRALMTERLTPGIRRDLETAYRALRRVVIAIGKQDEKRRIKENKNG
jgi:hypothetical protein